ncbi:cytochrome P450 [Arthrobacter sp. I2-34]|uniref:Cytochrome P450 n=1 Tax=Arthrobacter hankyongi TaxID=2904801 RepID=A0ABS9L9T9_9MICC|nr:cytochrome P450 [Arthrobacter hankyongi]MCG2623445.1 cytochrome P450 [Arthrobacter hankyongi]
MSTDLMTLQNPLPAIPMTRGCPFSPPAEYEQLRQAAEWHKVTVMDGRQIWMVPTYSAVRAVLGDPRFSAERDRPGFPYINQSQKELIKSSPAMVTVDEPLHSQIRRRATYAFTGKRVEALRESTQQLVDSLIDDMLAKGGPLDLVTEFALVIPSTIISGILGVPAEDHQHFHELTNKIFTLTNGPEGVAAGRLGLEAYIRELVLLKVQEPKDDLISRYVTEYLNTGELELEEVVTQIRTLLIAGHETTSSMIALGAAFLMEHPQYREQLRQGDDKIAAGAVEEMLRYLNIMHRGLVRMALEDVEIEGKLIKKGEGVLCALNSANRDAEVFAKPDELDFENPNRNHVAFGFGIHQCLGQGLARMEMQVAFKTLFTRIPDLKIAIPLSEVPFKTDVTVYGVHCLPVTW